LETKLIPNEEMATPFLHLKTLLRLVFNAQKFCQTFVNWYKTIKKRGDALHLLSFLLLIILEPPH
jgi:hypothetical protein